MCELNLDNIFLFVMTGVSALIVVIDLKVLEKMFEEYFLLRHYLDHETYFSCYKPQAEMRIIFQCYSIYWAYLCTLMTSVISIGLSEKNIHYVLIKNVQVVELLVGPLLFLICCYGLYFIRPISSVCTV